MLAPDPERMVPVAGGELCTQGFGSEEHPPILLIMGQMASMLWWPDEFCEWLADSGRRVLRFDNRDTGRSTSYEPGAPDYTFDDLVDDAIAVLDAFGVERAHIVGMSMGGMVAQVLAVRHPERVETLTLISTSPGDGGDGTLPGPSEDYLEHGKQFSDLDWDDAEAIAAMVVADTEAIAGTRHPHDAAAARRHVERDFERTANPASLVNHTVLEGEDFPAGGMTRITAPTLVLHGSSDPLFPLEHGEALAAAIDDAELQVIEGGGHELHRGDWDQVIDAIASHTSG